LPKPAIHRFDACRLGPTSEAELARILPCTSAMTASFIALLSGLSQDNFRCKTSRQASW
jgi:hypothetical protein